MRHALDIDGEIGLDGAHGTHDVAANVRRLSIGAYVQHHVGAIPLAERQIEYRSRRLAHRLDFHVADDADDRCLPLTAGAVQNPYAAADRALSTEKSTRHRRAHDRHIWRGAIVGVAKRSPGNDRHAHRREVAAVHVVVRQ